MSERRTDRELMDRPDIDSERLFRTLAQFESINRRLSSSRRLLKANLFPLMEKAARQQPEQPFVILDVGAGGCDIPKWVVLSARRNGWKVEIVALDLDPRIASWARESVEAFPEIRVVEGSALDLERFGTFDFIMANHFLHHLADEQIRIVIEKIDRQATQGLLINDLRRRIWAYLGFSIYGRLFARNSPSLVDGLHSIQKGFKPEELEVMIRGLDERGLRVFTSFPARIGLVRGPAGATP